MPYQLTSKGLSKLDSKRKGFSNKYISDCTGLDRGTIARIIGQEPVRIISIIRLYDFFDLDLEELDYINDPGFELKKEYLFAAIINDCNGKFSSHASHLKGFLIENFGLKKVDITSDWSCLSEDLLEEYHVFMVLASEKSLPDEITESVRKILSLQCLQKGDSKKISLIHIESALSLPIDNPINILLRDISQFRWIIEGDSHVNSGCLVDFFQDLLAEKLDDDLTGGSENPIPRFSNQILRPGKTNQSFLIYVGENPFRKLGGFASNLRDQKNQRITSACAYLGLGPALMWDRAYKDATSHMHYGLQTFVSCTQPLLEDISFRDFNYASLGTVDGIKDAHIIKKFFCRGDARNLAREFIYFPVDTSIEMLNLMSIEINNELSALESHFLLDHCFAINIDIESSDGIREFSCLVNEISKERPILYSFLGNTISNVEKPKVILERIHSLMKKKDRLLLEARIVHPDAVKRDRIEKTVSYVKDEYSNLSFINFAESAFLQFSNLYKTLSEKSSSYLVEVSKDQLIDDQGLRIDCYFENQEEHSLAITLLTGDIISLPSKGRIRLYRSYKFIPESLRSNLILNGFNVIREKEYIDPMNGTGIMIMLLEKQ